MDEKDTGSQSGDRLAQYDGRLFTLSDMRDAILMYLEYKTLYGREHENALYAALNEAMEGYDAQIELYDRGECPTLPLGEVVRRAAVERVIPHG